MTGPLHNKLTASNDKRDMRSILRIEHQAFAEPWTRTDFARFIRAENLVTVIHHKRRLIGYCCVMPSKNRHSWHILSIAVDEAYRRRGAATALLHRIQNRMSAGQRLVVKVPETCIEMQCLLRAVGIQAVSVRRNYFNSGRDCYLFKWKKQKPSRDRDSISIETNK